MIRMHVITYFATLFLSTLSFSQSSSASVAAYGNCPAPATAGVSLCFPKPAGVAAPLQVIAAGTGAGGPVKVMQLWVDHKKFVQVPGSLFDMPVDLASGTHRIVVVELDTTGQAIASAPVYVTVEGDTTNQACATPGSAGVNLCSPTPSSCEVADWTTVLAAGSSPAGTAVIRMELWVNGVKLYNSEGDLINTNLVLYQGERVVVQEVDNTGGHIASTPVYINPC